MLPASYQPQPSQKTSRPRYWTIPLPAGPPSTLKTQMVHTAYEKHVQTSRSSLASVQGQTYKLPHFFFFFLSKYWTMTPFKSGCSYLPVFLHRWSFHTSLTAPLHAVGPLRSAHAVFLPVRGSALPVRAPAFPESLCSVAWLGAHQRRGLRGCRTQKINLGQGWTVQGPQVSLLTGWVHRCRTCPQRWEQWWRRWVWRCGALFLCLHLALLFSPLIPAEKY